MSDYGYVNARLRSMRSRRLPAKRIDELLELPNLKALGEELGSTPYGEALARASGEKVGLPAVDQAISDVLRDVLGKCVRMTSDERGSALGLFLARANVQNLKVVLRAVRDKSGFDAVEPALVPLPPLDRKALSELCAQDDELAVAALLMTWGLPAGGALARVIQKSPSGVELEKLEHALDEAYFAHCVKLIENEDEEEDEGVIDALRIEVDLANLRGALKVASTGGGPLHSEPFKGGRVSRTLLERIASAAGLVEAANLIGQTPFRAARDLGLAAAAEAGDLGKVERILQRTRFRMLARGGKEDPLDVRFTLSFVAEAEAEAQNLRVVARKVAGLVAGPAAQEALFHV